MHRDIMIDLELASVREVNIMQNNGIRLIICIPKESRSNVVLIMQGRFSLFSRLC